jgi:hypothetical protein
MTTMVWPIEVLEPEQIRWQFRGGVSQGPVTMSGISQSGYFGGGGHWALSMTRVLVNSPTQYFAWRALETGLDNGAAPIIISIPDYGGIVRANGNPIVGVTYRDGVPHSDGSLFESDLIEVYTVDGAVMGATALRLDVFTGPEILAGMVFSALDSNGYPRRYQISTALAVDGEIGQYDITFRPPLRSDLAAGTYCNFSNPGLVMKLADPESITGDSFAGRFAEFSPIFVEYFVRTDA